MGYKERFTRFRALLKYIESTGRKLRLEYSDALLRGYSRSHSLSPYGREYDVSLQYLETAKQNAMLANSTLSRAVYLTPAGYTVAEFNDAAWTDLAAGCTREQALLLMLGLKENNYTYQKEAA